MSTNGFHWSDLDLPMSDEDDDEEEGGFVQVARVHMVPVEVMRDAEDINDMVQDAVDKMRNSGADLDSFTPAFFQNVLNLLLEYREQKFYAERSDNRLAEEFSNLMLNAVNEFLKKHKLGRVMKLSKKIFKRKEVRLLEEMQLESLEAQESGSVS